MRRLTDEEKSWLKILGALFVAMAAAVILTGCATPASIIEADRESIALVKAYQRNARHAVEGMSEAYHGQALDALSLQVALSLEQEAETIEFDSLDEDGRPLLDGRGYVIREARRVVALDVAQEITEIQREKADAIAAEVAEFLAAWEECQADLYDALELRRVISQYFDRIEGMSPEQIDAFSEAMAAEIERRLR